MHVSCAVDQESSVIPDKFDPNFPSFSNVSEHHQKSSVTPGLPAMFDVAGMQESTGNRSYPMPETSSLRSSAVAAAETLEAEYLSGYIYKIRLRGSNCSDNFDSGVSRILNTCFTHFGSGSEMITATANIVTSTRYSDPSCSEKVAVDAVPYTSDCVPEYRNFITPATMTVIAPTAAYPFPLSYVRLR
jgi:hypothetical protein